MTKALSKDSTAADVIAHLRAVATDDEREAKKRYGIKTDRALGVPHREQRAIAKTIGRNHERALALWDSGIMEAQMVGAFTADPHQMTPDRVREWVHSFDSWDMVDGAADMIAETEAWQTLAREFVADEGEFVRRTAYAIMCWASIHRKKEPDESFLPMLALIEKYAHDPRNFAKKGASWAFRSIGKRSPNMREAVLEIAHRMAASDDKATAWIGRDAIRDLNTDSTLRRMEKMRQKAKG